MKREKQELFLRLCREYAAVYGHLRVPITQCALIEYKDGSTKNIPFGTLMQISRAIVKDPNSSNRLDHDIIESLSAIDENWATVDSDLTHIIFMLANEVYYTENGDLRVPKTSKMALVYTNNVVRLYNHGSIMKIKRQIYKGIKDDRELIEENLSRMNEMDPHWILREEMPTYMPAKRKQIVYPNNIREIKPWSEGYRESRVPKKFTIRTKLKQFGKDVKKVTVFNDIVHTIQPLNISEAELVR